MITQSIGISKKFKKILINFDNSYVIYLGPQDWFQVFN